LKPLMDVMLAEDLSVWILNGMILTAGVGSSLLALVALIPASRGKRLVAFALAAPALLDGIGVSVWLLVQFLGAKHDPAYTGAISDLVGDLIFMAGPPLLTGCIAVLVILAKSASPRCFLTLHMHWTAGFCLGLTRNIASDVRRCND
jgi:hypothetical protein